MENNNLNQRRTASQNERILADLKAGKRITPLTAFTDYNCLRLQARIFELTKRGYSIVKRTVRTTSGKYVREYSMPN